MEDTAKEIVSNLEPPAGWWQSDSAARLQEVALAMLEEMDPDTVEECMTTIFGVVSAEYGE